MRHLAAHDSHRPGASAPAFELEDGADAFFEQPGAVQAGVGLLDPGEFRVLPDGELARVLPQRAAGPLQVPGVPGGDLAGAHPAAGDLPAGAVAGVVPYFAADLVEGLGGPGDDVEGVIPTSNPGFVGARLPRKVKEFSAARRVRRGRVLWWQ